MYLQWFKFGTKRLPTYWLIMLVKFRRVILNLQKRIINYVTLKSAAAVTFRRVGVQVGRKVPDSPLAFFFPSPILTLPAGRSPRLFSPFSGKYSVAVVWRTVPICLMKSNKSVSGIPVIPRWAGGVGSCCWVWRLQDGRDRSGWTDWLLLSLGMFADTLLSPWISTAWIELYN